MKIWKKYFLKEVLKVFGYFLFSFYAIYVFIDYASRASQFTAHHAAFSWKEVALYYFCEFSLLANLLIPVSLLIAVIHVLCKAQQTRQFIALLASGISMQDILKPFFFLGFICSLLLIGNSGWVSPSATRWMLATESSHKTLKRKKNALPTIQSIYLHDHSTLLYMDYDPLAFAFDHVFWIQDQNTVYQIKKLFLTDQIPYGNEVFFLERDSSGAFLVSEHYPYFEFKKMKINKKKLKNSLISSEARLLPELFASIQIEDKVLTNKEAADLAVLTYKLTVPWFALLAIFIPAPFCVIYTRQLPTFFIFFGSLFTLIALYIGFEALLLLAKKQVLPPLLTLLLPFFFFFSIAAFRFYRI